MVPIITQVEGNTRLKMDEEELHIVMTVGKITTGVAILLEEDSLQMIEVPSELVPEEYRFIGAKLVWKMSGSVEKQIAAKEQLIDYLRGTIKTMFSKRIEFKVDLKYIKMDENCKVSFEWIPLKQLLTPFKLISLDVYCGDTLLRIGVNADGGIHSVLDAEESELVISGLQVMQGYVFKFIARTNTGDYDGGTFKIRGMEDGLKGYGIYCANQNDLMIEVRELVDQLGGVWVENQKQAEINYFAIGEAGEDPDRLIDIMSIEWLRALKAGLEQ